MFIKNNLSRRSFIFVLLFFFICDSNCQKLPKNLTPCHLGDNDCLIKKTNEVLHSYKNGYPELFLDPLEPFKLDEIILAGNPKSQANFNIQMTNLLIYGLGDLMFTKLSGFSDVKNFSGDIEAFSPRFTLKGKHKIDGKVLIFPIKGDGDCELSIENVHIKVRMASKFETKDGKPYIKIDSLKMKMQMDKMKIQLDNLFNGDKALGDSLNKVLNENWKLLWDEFESEFNTQLAKAFEKIMNKVFSHISSSDLFLTDKKDK